MSDPVLLPHPLVGRCVHQPGRTPGPAGPTTRRPAGTPVARDADDVRRLAHDVPLAELDARVSVCSACPRLVALARGRRGREAGVVRRPALLGPSDPRLGRPRAPLLIVGLAPAANGGNRTGRIFTGDPSADWLFASLHRTGWAVQATSQHAGDGQRLVDARMVATVRCAPPENKPTAVERDTCAPWIAAELGLLPTVRVVVALGSFGWDGAVRALVAAGAPAPAEAAEFGHGAEVVAGRRHAAARLLPPLAAQHLHRPADAGDDGRRLRACEGADRMTT